MKAVLIPAHGGPEVLRYEEVATPEPGPGEVQVKVAAAALNHLDLWIRRGLPALKVALPHISGADAAGTISAVGTGARGVAVGDEVVINPVISCGRCVACLGGRDTLCREFSVLGEHRKGCLAEYVVVPAENVVAAPRGIDRTALAALPTTFMTAWEMLVGKARVQPGERVLVWAAGSGVGVAAVQIAKLFGAEVIATASTDDKLSRARQLGADHTINHAKEDVSQVARKLAPGGAEIVFEHTGAQTWPSSILACARGGRIVTCGATSGWDAKTDLRHVFFRQLAILGSTMAPKATLHVLLRHVAAGRLRPIIDRTFPLSETAAAQRRLEEREQFGKIVLLPEPGHA